MSKVFRSEEAEQRAWSLFRNLIRNEEQFFSFYNLGLPLQITGSAGGIYDLYSNGGIISNTEGKGRIYQRGNFFPIADVFTTAYIWITANETEFRKRWGCGNIAINVYRDLVLGANKETNIFGFDEILCLDLCSTRVKLKENVFSKCPKCKCLYFYIPETQEIIYNFRNNAFQQPQEITDIRLLNHYLNLLQDEDDPIVNLILKYRKKI